MIPPESSETTDNASPQKPRKADYKGGQSRAGSRGALALPASRARPQAREIRPLALRTHPLTGGYR